LEVGVFGDSHLYLGVVMRATLKTTYGKNEVPPLQTVEELRAQLKERLQNISALETSIQHTIEEHVKRMNSINSTGSTDLLSKKY
jgi:hypothetical protein